MFGLMPFERRQNSMSYNPFREMEEMERAFFGNHSLSEFKTDIQDKGDSYELTTDLPGFAKEDIHLDLEGDVLTVSAERHSEWEDSDKKGNYLRCERSFGQYSRSFDVSNVETDQIRADYNNGVLKLTLPKKGKTVPASRRIEIR
ncbi:MAG: Hsp20/alpha crystallin family protein [Candidatus Heritagella sp.]